MVVGIGAGGSFARKFTSDEGLDAAGKILKSMVESCIESMMETNEQKIKVGSLEGELICLWGVKPLRLKDGFIGLIANLFFFSFAILLAFFWISWGTDDQAIEGAGPFSFIFWLFLSGLLGFSSVFTFVWTGQGFVQIYNFFKNGHDLLVAGPFFCEVRLGKIKRKFAFQDIVDAKLVKNPHLLRNYFNKFTLVVSLRDGTIVKFPSYHANFSVLVKLFFERTNKKLCPEDEMWILARGRFASEFLCSFRRDFYFNTVNYDSRGIEWHRKLKRENLVPPHLLPYVTKIIKDWDKL